MENEIMKFSAKIGGFRMYDINGSDPNGGKKTQTLHAPSCVDASL